MRFGNRSVRRIGQRRTLRVEPLEDRRLLTLVPQLVIDSVTRGIGSSPEEVTDVNGVTYFTADDGQHGRELWRSDGAESGTRLVADLTPGCCDPGAKPRSSALRELTAVGDTLYFTHDDPATGRELWKSNGTSAGTVLVADIQPGVWGSEPTNLFAWNGRLLFTAFDSVHGYELWISDGTADGTTLLKDIAIDSNGSQIENFFAFKEHVYFSARQPESGRRLWRTDGTTEGTSLAAESSLGFTDPASFVIWQDRLYFSAFHQDVGRELWSTDGTSDGTQLVADIVPGSGSSEPNDLVATFGGLVFAARDPEHGRELWRSDGTSGGTALVSDIRPGPSDSYPRRFAVVGDRVVFLASDATGQRLWSTDGASEATLAISPSSDFRDVAQLGGFIYFAASTPTFGNELWRSDGTIEGTSLVADVNQTLQSGRNGDSNPHGLVASGGRLFFAANSETNDIELWSSDGTTQGTSRVKDVQPATLGMSVNYLFEHEGKLHFSNGSTIWATDGSSPGAVNLRDVTPSMAYGPLLPTSNGDAIFYWGLVPGAPASTSAELWRTDGTAEGTYLIKDIRPGSASSLPLDRFPVRVPRPVAANGVLYFFADDGQHGLELWRSDGTEAGTFLLKDIRLGHDSCLPSLNATLIVAGNTVYFAATDENGRAQLWQTDGTQEGTIIVPGPETRSRVVDVPVVDGESVYFSLSSANNRSELWRASGGSAERVKSLWSETDRGAAQRLTFVGEVLYFAAGGALWRSDGTESGTVIVRDRTDDFSVFSWSDLVDFNGMLFFSGRGPTTGLELWKSDGTEQGTVLVANIWADEAGQPLGSSYPLDFIAARGALFFTADDGVHGRELWKTDGTPNGTTLVADLRPGCCNTDGKPSGSLVESLIVVGRNLYFTADDGLHGREVWTLAPPPGDTNFDGQVDLADLNSVRNHFGTVGNSAGDANGDGIVDLADLNEVRNYFGAGALPASTTNRATGSTVLMEPRKNHANVSLTERERSYDLLFAAAEPDFAPSWLVAKRPRNAERSAARR